MEKERSNREIVINNSCKVENTVTFASEELPEAVENASRVVGASTILASQNMATAMLESSNLLSSSITEMTKSNVSISQSVRQGAVTIFNGLGKISDEMERNSKINEYHMLQKEIEEYEDWLLHHGLLKQFYETVKIEKEDELHISQENIAFITSIFCGEDASSAIQLMRKKDNTVLEFYLKGLIGKKMYLKNKQIIVDDRVLVSNYENLGKVRASADNKALEFVIGNTAIKIESNVDDYFIPYTPPFLIENTTTIENYCEKLFKFMVKQGEDSIEARSKINHFYFYIVPSAKQLAMLLKKMNCPNVNKLADLQRTIALINVDNSLNYLRNLHEQLRLTIRNYKIEVAIA